MRIIQTGVTERARAHALAPTNRAAGSPRVIICSLLQHVDETFSSCVKSGVRLARWRSMEVLEATTKLRMSCNA